MMLFDCSLEIVRMIPPSAVLLLSTLLLPTSHSLTALRQVPVRLVRSQHCPTGLHLAVHSQHCTYQQLHLGARVLLT